MLITIHADKVEDVAKKLDSLVRKADRYGKKIAYKIGDEYAKEVCVYSIDEVNHIQYKTGSYMTPAIDIEIESDGLIKSDGWEVLCKIEHGDILNRRDLS